MSVLCVSDDSTMGKTGVDVGHKGVGVDVSVVVSSIDIHASCAGVFKVYLCQYWAHW